MKTILKLAILLLIGLVLFFVFLVKENKTPVGKRDDEKLSTLAYLTWVPAGKSLNMSGVTRCLPTESFKGFNLYNSRDQSVAYLMDMKGTVVHRWQARQGDEDTWHHVKVCGDGDLLAIVKDRALMCLDFDSRLKWIKGMRFHHDISVAENGDIYTIVSREGFVIRAGLPFPVLLDYIAVLSPSGRIKREIPLYRLLKDFIPDKKFFHIYSWLLEPGVQQECRARKREKGCYLPMGTPADMLHTNAVEVISREVAGLCQRGDLLISMRELDMIAIIDPRREKLTWHWGPGVLEKQHQPTLLDNGHILVFDNGERERKYSRVVEIDPLEKKIVWQYRANPPRKFFSVSRGGNQRLPNGSTLITESDRGRVFEVTPAGKIVWEFYNPRLNKRQKTRAAIYRLTRVWDTTPYPFLKNFPPH
jgi:hypothetical protein